MKVMTDKDFEEVKTVIETVWHIIQLGKSEQLAKHQTEIIQVVNLLTLMETSDAASDDRSDNGSTCYSYVRPIRASP